MDNGAAIAQWQLQQQQAYANAPNQQPPLNHSNGQPPRYPQSPEPQSTAKSMAVAAAAAQKQQGSARSSSTQPILTPQKGSLRRVPSQQQLQQQSGPYSPLYNNDQHVNTHLPPGSMPPRMPPQQWSAQYMGRPAPLHQQPHGGQQPQMAVAAPHQYNQHQLAMMGHPQQAPPPQSMMQGYANGMPYGYAPPMMMPAPRMTGSAVLRLLQYSEYLSTVETRTLSQWQRFVAEFFAPHGTVRIALWNSKLRESKLFELPFPVLPQYYHVNFESGLRQLQLVMERAREIVTPSNGHRVECERATMLHWFKNGSQVVSSGTLLVQFTPAPSLKIESFEFLTNNHVEYLPRGLLASVSSPNSPYTTPQDLSTSSSTTSPTFTSRSHPANASARVALAPIRLPESPVNDFGITLRTMRCLEVAESVSHMRELIEYSIAQNQGPIDALESFVRSFEEQLQAGRQQQAAASAAAAAANAAVSGTYYASSPATSTASPQLNKAQLKGRAGRSPSASPKIGSTALNRQPISNASASSSSPTSPSHSVQTTPIISHQILTANNGNKRRRGSQTSTKSTKHEQEDELEKPPQPATRGSKKLRTDPN